MKKILFIIESPSPYRVAFFRELGKLCDLTVYFTRDERHYGRQLSWYDFDFTGFKAISPKCCFGRMSFEISTYLNKSFDLIILCDYASPTGIWASWRLNQKKLSYAMEADGGFPGNGKGIKEQIKRWVMSRASYWFSTAEITDHYFLQYGAKAENIIRYPFTSLHESDIEKCLPSQTEKLLLRKKLNMQEEKIIVSVGRFIYSKGFDVLFDACATLPENTGIYIIGGRPTQEYLDKTERLKLNNLHFVDFMSSDKLKEYYLAADLFVLPTRSDVWGLVINEAMACGLPVITTDHCIAGTELIHDGYNGYIVPVGDTDKLGEKMRLTLQSDDMDAMAENALCTVRSYTFENMAKIHADVFEKILPIVRGKDIT